jgi:Prokaryotic Cytochrome C oxidase subunit IV
MRCAADRLDFTWIALIALALATMALAGLVRNAVLVDGAVLAIAAIKGRRILLDYLDLRAAPAPWRGLATAWLMLIVGFAWAVSAVSALLS